jgi:CRISPR-associated protein Csd1
MLLRDLHNLHAELVTEGRLQPIAFETKPVQYFVELDKDGSCVGVSDVGAKGEPRPVPDIRRSGAKAPAFPCIDNAQYVLGVAKKPGEAGKALSAFGEYHKHLAQAIAALAGWDESTAERLRAVERFTSDREEALAALALRDVTFEADAKGDVKAASSRICFRVDGIDPTEAKSFRTWWAGLAGEDLASGAEGICQITNQPSSLVRKLPGLAVQKGTPQSLIAANFPAAERYNASQSTGSRIGAAAALSSHQTLNWLLADPAHHRYAGGLTFVWWLDGDLAFDGFNIILEPNADDVAAMFSAPWTGRPGVTPTSAFRLLVISLNDARVVIRADHTTSLAEFEVRTRLWLGSVQQTRADGTSWWPSIFDLAAASAPGGDGSARKARNRRAVDLLARCAITSVPLPMWMLSSTLARIRVEPLPRRGKSLDFRLIGSRNAVLSLYRTHQEEFMTDPRGQLCGRLLAQLEAAQYAALGDLNRTVVDRYYGAASVTPARVFPGLMRDLHAHLNKAGRQHKGAQVAISRRVGVLSQEIVDAGGIPGSLTLEAQADFALGYWTERQARFASRTTETQIDSTTTEKD